MSREVPITYDYENIISGYSITPAIFEPNVLNMRNTIT